MKSIHSIAQNENIEDSTMLECLSEGSSFLNTIPKELKDRKKYLNMNKDYRLEYEQLKEQFLLWITDAKEKLKSAEENKNDYKNIVLNLEQLKVCDIIIYGIFILYNYRIKYTYKIIYLIDFSIYINLQAFFNDQTIHALVTKKIKQSIDKIRPSLTSQQNDILTIEQQSFNKDLENIINMARIIQEQFEEEYGLLKEYRNLVDKVSSILDRCNYTEDSIQNIAGLYYNIEKLTLVHNDLLVSTSKIV